MRRLWAVMVPIAALALASAWWLVGKWVPPTSSVPADLVIGHWLGLCRPEPLEQIRYLVCISLLPLVFWLGALWDQRVAHGRLDAILESRLGIVWVVSVQVALIACVIGLLVHQTSLRGFPLVRFPWRSVLVVLGVAAAWRWTPGARAQVARFGQAASATWLTWILRQWHLPLLIALACTATEMLPSLYRSSCRSSMTYHIYEHHTFAMGEFGAVLNGRTPLVDFYPQYQYLLSYLLAPAFRQVGLSVFTFTTAMCCLSALCLLAVGTVFRRLTGNPWIALALYLPFLWLSVTLFVQRPQEQHQRIGPFNYYQVGPIRYFGPWITVAVLAWCLRRPTWQRLSLVFLVAGWTAINNLDFGLPALVGTLIAIVCGTQRGPWPGWRCLAWMVSAFLVGVGAALASFACLTFLHSGSLPQFSQMLNFQRTFAVVGFNMLPVPGYGLNVVIYLTFMAAIASGLWQRRTYGELSPGLLLFSGVFGCGALGYYVGRSHNHVLICVFSAWGFSLLLLLFLLGAEMVKARKAGTALWPFALPGLLLGSLYLMCFTRFDERPNIRNQIARLRDSSPSTEWTPIVEFVRARTHLREKVCIIHKNGHLLALDAGVENVYPFEEINSILLRDQVEVIARALRQNGVRQVCVAAAMYARFPAEVGEMLADAGFRETASSCSSLMYFVRQRQ
jgi:hypothetical protein